MHVLCQEPTAGKQSISVARALSAAQHPAAARACLDVFDWALDDALMAPAIAKATRIQYGGSMKGTDQCAIQLLRETVARRQN